MNQMLYTVCVYMCVCVVRLHKKWRDFSIQYLYFVHFAFGLCLKIKSKALYDEMTTPKQRETERERNVEMNELKNFISYIINHYFMKYIYRVCKYVCVSEIFFFFENQF